MEITGLKLTESEINEAVGLWLKERGISLPVLTVSKRYQYSSEYTVELYTKEEIGNEESLPAIPPISPPIAPVNSNSNAAGKEIPI